MIQLGGRCCIIFPLSLVSHGTAKANKMCSRVRVDKNLCDVFPIRNGLKKVDALLALLLNFALGYAIRKVQVIQDGLKLNDTH